MISKKRSYEKKKFLEKSKSAQSQIVASVLLILIAIATVVIIMNFVIPFVRNQLSGADCLDVTGKVSIQNNPKYTCITIDNRVSVQVHVGDVDESISGFMIELGGASSKSFEIRAEEMGAIDGIFMYPGEDDEEALELPGKNEERTYVIAHELGYIDFVKVYPILLNDKTCDSSDIVNNIGQCKV